MSGSGRVISRRSSNRIRMVTPIRITFFNDAKDRVDSDGDGFGDAKDYAFPLAHILSRL